MARKKRQEESSGGSPEWMTTYSDLVTLLLCFFVLLFSFSSVDAEKFKAIMASFQGGSGVLNGGTSMDFPISLIEDDLDIEVDLRMLMEYLQEYAETVGLEDKIVIQVEERGLVVRFADNVFFDSGSADIKSESVEILKSVAELLNREEFIKRQIKVEGHTDTDPILKSAKFPSNWELSSARANNVLRYLVESEGMDGGRVSSSGYSYYRPITSNDTVENKAQNRRVDIVILKDIYEELEPQ
jgi:chemotaxis protein MotB